MRRRFLQLFRAWIPSWRFFETLSEQPVLFYRVAPAEGGDLGAWRVAIQRPRRSWYALALNGEGNLHLACYALLDQLEEDIGEIGEHDATQLDAITQTPSYQLVQNLVCYLLRERNEWHSGCRYQFKIGRMPVDGAGACEDMLVSPLHKV